MMLKFTANISMLFTEVDLVDRFEMAKKAGFDAVEIQFPYSLSAQKIKALLDENQLNLVLFNIDADDLLLCGEGLASVPEKKAQFRLAVAQALEYAQLIKPEVINVLPGRCYDSTREQEYLSVFKENLAFATENFAPLGIKTVFEAINTKDMPGFIINNGQDMLDILEDLSLCNLFMQYDIYHMTMMGENVLDFISRYGDLIGHIQFADCPGRGQPGTGEINFAEVFSAIEMSAYSGWVGAEYKPVGKTINSVAWL